FGDYNPTPSDVAAVDASCRQIAKAAKRLDGLQQTDLPALNQKLAAVGARPLPGLPVISGGCSP
ncbi:MAG: hypothetical protein ACRD2D_14620, partial [Terriglobales bacterium]